MVKWTQAHINAIAEVLQHHYDLGIVYDEVIDVFAEFLNEESNSFNETAFYNSIMKNVESGY